MEKAVEAMFKGLGDLPAKFQAHPWGTLLLVALALAVAVGVVLGLRLR
jgi:hypothetical protein